MEIVLAPPGLAALPRLQADRLVAVEHVEAVPRMKEAEDLIRLASIGAITFSIAVPLVVLAQFAFGPSSLPHFLLAAAATAVYLPLHVDHVRSGLCGKRSPRLRLTLGAMAVVIIGATPLLGAEWFYAFSALVASVLVTTAPRFSFPATAGILVVVGIWAGGLLPGGLLTPVYGGGLASYFPLAVAVRAATVFVLVWLVGALRSVQSARVALAGAALEAERARIEFELRETVAAELAAVVVKGVHAEDAASRGSPTLAQELESLVEGSRLALANARRITRGYKLAAPAAELEKAASLLRAAGIETTIELPDVELPTTLDESLRSALQAAVLQLLSQEAAGPTVLKLGYRSGQFQVEAVRQATCEPAA